MDPGLKKRTVEEQIDDLEKGLEKFMLPQSAAWDLVNAYRTVAALGLADREC